MAWRLRKDNFAPRATDAITPATMSAGKQIKSGGEGLCRTLTRRRFIHHTVAGIGMATGASLIPGFAAPKLEAGPAWRCRLSTSSILFKDLSLEEACARIAALGFEAVDRARPKSGVFSKSISNAVM